MEEHKKLTQAELDYLESQSVNEAGKEYAVEEKKRRFESSLQAKAQKTGSFLSKVGKAAYSKAKPGMISLGRGVGKVGGEIGGYASRKATAPRRRKNARELLGGFENSGVSNDYSAPSWAKFDFGGYSSRKRVKRGSSGGLWWAKF